MKRNKYALEELIMHQKVKKADNIYKLLLDREIRSSRDLYSMGDYEIKHLDYPNIKSGRSIISLKGSFSTARMAWQPMASFLRGKSRVGCTNELCYYTPNNKTKILSSEIHYSKVPCSQSDSNCTSDQSLSLAKNIASIGFKICSIFLAV